jgi:predicted lipid carrier protein YhbT
VARFLTDEWIDELQKLGTGPAPFGDVSGRVQMVVTGGPDKDVKYVLVLDGGRVAEARAGAAADADLTLTVEYANAVALQQGELDPSVAFMQGRSKAAGDTGLLLALLPAMRTDAYRAFREKLTAVTDF